jgi:N-acetylneuraminate lyase
MKYQHFTGLIPAPFTPMHVDGSLNITLVKDYFNMIYRNDIRAAFICGTTGEGPSLTISECKALAEAWVDAAKGVEDFKIMTVVGGTSLEDCKELAIHAKQIGLYGISLLSPYYYKPSSVEVIAACCKEVAAVVPDMPFYYYHIPITTGVNFPMIELLRLVHDNIPNFVGIKYSHEDHMDLLSCLQFQHSHYDILWGRDENLLSGMSMGIKAAIGSTYNYIAPLYLNLIDAFNSGDLQKARELQSVSIELIKLLIKYGGIPTGKAYMQLVGVDCGPCRLPLQNLTSQRQKQFLEELSLIDFDLYKMK